MNMEVCASAPCRRCIAYPPASCLPTISCDSWPRFPEVPMANESAVQASPGPANSAWQLEDFVDCLVVELDKTRETLAVKAINKPLSYSVKEVALDLNIFPSYV